MHSSRILDAYVTQIDATVRASMQQKIMDELGRSIKTLTPKIVQLGRDMAAQLKAAGETEQPTHAPPGAQPSPSPPPAPAPPLRP